MNWTRLSLCTLLAVAILAPSLSEARPRQIKQTSFKATVMKRTYNQRPAGIHSHRGKIMARRQLKAGNISAARLILKKMTMRPNRKGLKGQVDRFRKWSVNRAIQKKVHQKEVEAWLNKKHKPIPLELLPYWTKL